MSVEEKIRELLEATAPGKSGVKAEPMPKIAKNKEDGDMEDTGPAVTDPEQAKGPDASKKVKKDTSAPTKGAVPPEKGDKIKEGFTDEEFKGTFPSTTLNFVAKRLTFELFVISALIDKVAEESSPLIVKV